MSFFKKLKGKLLGSIKEDLNSALTGKQKLFNSKIAGALDDLIAMKTGINISNIPEGITEQGLLSAEERKIAEKALQQNNAFSGGYTAKDARQILRFPTDDNRYVDNWIIFRSVPKSFDATLTQAARDGIESHGIQKVDDFRDGDKVEDSTLTSMDATIALYFPSGVKDAINVEYEQKEIGMSDVAMDKLLNNADISGVVGEAPAMVGEMFDKAKQSMVAFESFQRGVVIDNPKFNTFQGVSFRDHSYTFQLTPYNVKDAEEITKIITLFKTLMLPMSTNKNRRMMIMPSEFSIDFKGPILGHIEHPQNCFLKSCDVDYSGGKDMSFIEGIQETDVTVETGQGESQRTELKRVRGLQHYPNGVTLSLVFQEILNIDRLRYVDRVRAAAKGKKQEVQTEIDEFEKNINAEDISATQQSTYEEEIRENGYPKDFDPWTFDAFGGYFGAKTNKDKWDAMTQSDKDRWFRQNDKPWLASDFNSQGNGTGG